MSASPADDELAAMHTPADFGLHRGRRVLGGFVLVGLLTCAGLVFWRQAPEPQPATAKIEAPVPAEETGLEPVALRRLPPKRRAKAARIGSHASVRAPASVAREPGLSPPPLLPAVVEAAPPALEPVADEPAKAVAAPAVADAEESDDGNGEAIARSIAAAKRSAVQTCFERELKQTPTLKGTLIVELDLAPPHRVNAVRVSDDLDRPAFSQCVSTTMEQLTFVALNEEVSIRVPYLLSAQAK